MFSNHIILKHTLILVDMGVNTHQKKDYFPMILSSTGNNILSAILVLLRNGGIE